MLRSSRSVAGAFLAAAVSAFASGPVDFGMSELNAALAGRNLKYKPRIVTEINLEAPETFRIEPYAAGGGRIAGGDLRGLMYGLLEAAEQIRATGRLKQTHGVPSLAIRGVKIAAEPAAGWFASGEFWQDFMKSLAQDRFNRLQLVFDRLPAKDALPNLRTISQIGLQYGVDLALGIKSAPEDFGPTLQDFLSQCTAIRSVALVGEDAGVKQSILQVLGKAGRRVMLDDGRLWQIDPAQGEESARSLMPTLTGGFEVVTPRAGDGRPDPRILGVWGRLGYNP